MLYINLNCSVYQSQICKSKSIKPKVPLHQYCPSLTIICLLLTPQLALVVATKVVLAKLLWQQNHTGSFSRNSFQIDLIIEYVALGNICNFDWKLLKILFFCDKQISSFLNFSASLDTKDTLRCALIEEWNKFWSEIPVW